MRIEHLSAEDVTVAGAQVPDAPLQIGGVGLCDAAALRAPDGTVPIERLREHVTACLEAAPRLRKKLVSVPLGQGLAWVDDAHFDIARHVRLVSLPAPGGEDQLREFLVRLLETPLAPSRPLWEFWVVDGLSGDRIALVPKASHVLGDGMAVLGLIMSMFDLEAAVERPAVPARWSHVPAPAAFSMVTGAVVERWRRRSAALRLAGHRLVHPVLLSERVLEVARAGRSVLADLARPPLGTGTGGRRDYAWARLPLAELERVKKAESVKLNDVVLSISTAGLSRYLERSGAGVDRLRVVVPVSVHGADLAGEVENRFTMVFVSVDDTGDPLARLREVHAETSAVKGSAQARLGAGVLSLGGLVPYPLLRTAAPLLLHHQRLVDVVVTNLAGSPAPVYLLGARLREMYPFLTLTANLPVAIGVVSYDGALGIGVTVDPDVVPDATAVARCLEEAAWSLVRASAAARPV